MMMMCISWGRFGEFLLVGGLRGWDGGWGGLISYRRISGGFFGGLRGMGWTTGGGWRRWVVGEWV